jgi:hypothetical protein
MKYFKIGYECGYCGADEELYIVAENESEAEEIAAEGLEEYAEEWLYLRTGWDNEYLEDFEDYEDVAEEFKEDCTYYVEEVDEEEYRENI